MRNDSNPKGDYVELSCISVGDVITWAYHPDYVVTAIHDKKQRKGARRRLLVTVTDTETNETKVLELPADSRAVVTKYGKPNND